MTPSLAELARLLRAIDDGDPHAIAEARLGRARRVATPVWALSGPAGAGKSTLLGGLVAALRAGGARVAVLAVDPSSPRSGGALLGDRLRLGALTDDPDVLFRSLATRGSNGGLSLAVAASVDALCGAGFDVVLIETVGVGQSEVDVEAVADAVAVVLAPGQGDDIQAMKAGLLEIADVLVVNKADRPGAARLVAELSAMRALSHDGRDVPVLATTATKLDGVGPLLELLQRAGPRSKQLNALARREAIARRAGERARDFVLRWLQSEAGTQLLAAVQWSDATLDDTAVEALRAALAVAPEVDGATTTPGS